MSSMLYIWRHANRVQQFQKHDALSIVAKPGFPHVREISKCDDEKEARRNIYGICVPMKKKHVKTFTVSRHTVTTGWARSRSPNYILIWPGHSPLYASCSGTSVKITKPAMVIPVAAVCCGYKHAIMSNVVAVH